MRKLLLLSLVAAGLTFGGVTAFSQEGQPDNTAEQKPAEQSGDQYTVKPGDSLSKISKQIYGSEEGWQAIATANNIPNPDMISVGQTLTIPAKPEMAAAAPAAEQKPVEEQAAAEQKPAEEKQASAEQKPAEEGKQAAEEKPAADAEQAKEEQPADAKQAKEEPKPAEETAKKEEMKKEETAAAEQTEIKGEVTAVAAPDLKLKDDKGTTHSLKVEDAKMLEGIKVGDDVKVTLVKGKPTIVEKLESISKKEG